MVRVTLNNQFRSPTGRETVGKHFTAEVYRQFKPLQTAPEHWESPEDRVYLTEAERRQQEEWHRDRMRDEAEGRF